jgi:hypothetical protein
MNSIIFNMKKKIEATKHHDEEGAPLRVVVSLEIKRVGNKNLMLMLCMACDRGTPNEGPEGDPEMSEMCAGAEGVLIAGEEGSPMAAIGAEAAEPAV